MQRFMDEVSFEENGRLVRMQKTLAEHPIECTRRNSFNRSSSKKKESAPECANQPVPTSILGKWLTVSNRSANASVSQELP